MPFCHHCGQALVGVYIQAEGKFYHKQCFEKHVVPRCAYCDRPLIGSYIQAEGKVYHKQCFEEHVLPRCVYCQEPLRDRYQIDAWGNQYCQRHQREYPLCSFCGRLVPPEQQTPGWRAYGSERCLVCRSTAIDAIEQAQPLFQRCKQWIAEQGFRFNRLPLHLELHDRAVLLGMLHGRSVNHPLGVTLSSRWSQPGHVYSSSVDGVAVLQGLPATLFAGVVLHELGHVWLTVHGIEGLPSWGEEGFCQLISYTYYMSLDTPEARVYAHRLEAESDPVYGEGFRRVRTLAAHGGFGQFVEALRVTRRLPASR